MTEMAWFTTGVTISVRSAYCVTIYVRSTP